MGRAGCGMLVFGALLIFAPRAITSRANPIISGEGKFRYQYMPERLQFPEGLYPNNDHGLILDDKNNIILTYEPFANDSHCMVAWNPDGTGGVSFGPGPELCTGVPHGLRIAHEGNEIFLYHANNAATLHKTKLDGTLVWTVKGAPRNETKFVPYKPTWFAAPPGSPFVFMADGYGSNYVHVFSTGGKYTGHSFGGRGTEHGKFQTCHSINYDPRTNQLVVSDRENHRHQWFDFDPLNPGKFVFSHAANTTTSGPSSRPCNMRFKHGNGYSIVPDLVGPVGILDERNNLVSTIHVGKLLGHLGHLHPHDALFLENGDIVVATWNPGRISYWKHLPE